jgi:hypothetical protein
MGQGCHSIPHAKDNISLTSIINLSPFLSSSHSVLKITPWRIQGKVFPCHRWGNWVSGWGAFLANCIKGYSQLFEKAIKTLLPIPPAFLCEVKFSSYHSDKTHVALASVVHPNHSGGRDREVLVCRYSLILPPKLTYGSFLNGHCNVESETYQQTVTLKSMYFE